MHAHAAHSVCANVVLSAAGRASERAAKEDVQVLKGNSGVSETVQEPDLAGGI